MIDEEFNGEISHLLYETCSSAVRARPPPNPQQFPTTSAGALTLTVIERIDGRGLWIEFLGPDYVVALFMLPS